MPTIRLELYRGKTLSEGRHPVCVTVTKGLPKRKSIDACLPEEWDEKTKLIKVLRRKETAEIASRNRHIDDEFTKYKAIFKALNEGSVEWKAEDVFQEAAKLGTGVKIEPTFWELSAIYLDYIKHEKSGASFITYEGILNKFRKFAKNDQLRLSDFDVHLIDRYRRFMKKKGNGNSTMHSNFKVLRFISSYAAKKGLASKPEALHSFELPKKKAGAKPKLSDAQLTSFENAFALKDSLVEEAQDIFLIAYLFRGMRIRDVIKMEQSFIKGNRLVYTSNKNEKLFDMKIPAQALTILSKYLDDRKYVFSFYKWKPDPALSQGDNNVNEYEEIKRITSNINNRLKKLANRAGIDKLSTHIARHTFARKALGMIKDTNITMDLLGHSSLAIHEAYVREITKSDDLDNAADSIFD